MLSSTVTGQVTSSAYIYFQQAGAKCGRKHLFVFVNKGGSHASDHTWS